MTDPELAELARLRAHAERQLELFKCRKAESDREVAGLIERAVIVRLYGPRRPTCYAWRLRVHARLRRAVSTAPRQRRPRGTRPAPRDDPDPPFSKECPAEAIGGAISSVISIVRATHRNVVSGFESGRKPVARALLPIRSARPCPSA